ncbi:COP23 domain-containing protein [Nostoc sp.]|uniref:COP23 domain-containing protein n=1 Tax=Nostoc sp. TaxID=1180 RepID=UPI002FFAE4BE
MKIKSKQLVTLTASVVSMTTGFALGLSPINYAKAQQAANYFSCETIQGIPTTVVKTPNGEKQLISWDSTYFEKAGYPPQVRCLQVTSRLNLFFNAKTENSLDTGTMNSHPVILIVDENTGEKSLLYTLKPGQDGEKTIELLMRQVNSFTNEPPLREGSCHTSLNLNSLVKGKPQATTACS